MNAWRPEKGQYRQHKCEDCIRFYKIDEEFKCILRLPRPAMMCFHFWPKEKYIHEDQS